MFPIKTNSGRCEKTISCNMNLPDLSSNTIQCTLKFHLYSAGCAVLRACVVTVQCTLKFHSYSARCPVLRGCAVHIRAVISVALWSQCFVCFVAILMQCISFIVGFDFTRITLYLIVTCMFLLSLPSVKSSSKVVYLFGSAVR